MKQGILLVTTSRWPSAALLAMAFSDVGCRVEVVCPRGHPARHTRAVLRVHRFQRLAPLRSLRQAIAASQPSLVIPCDDPATVCLHRLYAWLQPQGPSSVGMRDVLERSLGPAESHPIADARSRLIALARSEGILVPETAAVETADHLRAWLAQNGLPAVLKADGTTGGTGVRIIHTVAEGEQAFAKLTARPGLLFPGWRRPNPTVTVQSFITGRDATSSVACWKGQRVASIDCVVVKTLYARGPASVLRLIDNGAMHKAAGQLIECLGLSGIYGFDFRLDARTGEAHLIEMNARATQISHLAMGTGRDLAAALHASLAGAPVPPTRRVTENGTLVLFPQEWNRDPSSEFLRSGFHDVPWREPKLVKHCVDHFLPDPNGRAGANAERLWQILRERRTASRSTRPGTFQDGRK